MDAIESAARRSAASRAAPGSSATRADHAWRMSPKSSSETVAPRFGEKSTKPSVEASEAPHERGTRDAELLGQRRLAQPRAARKFTRQDPLPERFVHVVDDAWIRSGPTAGRTAMEFAYITPLLPWVTAVSRP